MNLLPGAMPVISIALCVLSIVSSTRISLLLLVASSPLTTIAVLSVGKETIELYHLLWLVLAVKIVYFRIKTGEPLRKPWVWFLLFCLFSIVFALFSTGALVVNPDGEVAYVRFSFQQFTQWGYLLTAVTTAWFVMYGLRSCLVELRSVLIALDIGLVLVLSVAFLQFVLPADLITELFRNSAHVIYKSAGERISSTFSEPSFLSAFLVPMTALHCVRMIRKPNFFSVAVILLSTVVAILSQSSSALIGFAVLGVVLLVFAISRFTYEGIHPITIVCAALGALVLAVLIFAGAFDKVVIVLIAKLDKGNSSGIDRSFSMNLHWHVFLDHALTGVGWGTARSKDLLTTWLAELGAVGFALFLVPFVRLCSRLCSMKNEDRAVGLGVFSYLVVAVAIMFISVAEPYYLPFWIVAGAGCFLTSESCGEGLERSFKNSASPPRLRSRPVKCVQDSGEDRL